MVRFGILEQGPKPYVVFRVPISSLGHKSCSERALQSVRLPVMYTCFASVAIYLLL